MGPFIPMSRILSLLLCWLLTSPLAVFAQSTRIDYRTQVKNKPILSGAPLPTSCIEAGDLFLLTTGALPLYICNGTTYQPVVQPMIAQPYNAQDYNFTPQAFTSTLTSGVPTTQNLTPCPAGVSGTDTKHPIFISQGTGAAEAAFITGGTCVSGAATGTIAFTPANNHSGTWQISSANGGITEAEEAIILAAGGGEVYMPAGTYLINAAIPFMPNIAFAGEGVGTLLMPASCSSIIFDANVPVHATSEYYLVVDNISFSDFLIEGAQCLGINSLVGIQEINQTGSHEVWSIAGVDIRNVYFDNVYGAVNLDRSKTVTLTDVKTYENSVLMFGDSSYPQAFNSTEIAINNWQYNWHPMASNDVQVTMVRAPIVCESCEVFSVTNSRIPGRPIASEPAINIVGGEDINIKDNEFETWYTAIQFSRLVFTDTLVTVYPGFVQFTGNSMDNLWGPYFNIDVGTSSNPNNQCHDFIISNNFFTNPNNTITQPILLDVPPYSRDFTINQNVFANLTSSGETALVVGANTDNIQIGPGNLFTNKYAGAAAGTALFVDATATNVKGIQPQTCILFATCVADAGATLSSSTVLTLTGISPRSQYTVTGNVPIMGINTCSAQTPNTPVTFMFGAGATVISSGTLRLAGNFGPTSTSGSLTVSCSSPYWNEISRAVN